MRRVRRASNPISLLFLAISDRRLAVRLALPVGFPAGTRAPGLAQHPDQHRPQRPVLLAVDQKFGEGAALCVAPELPDPVETISARADRGVSVSTSEAPNQVVNYQPCLLRRCECEDKLLIGGL
jgi:hypothetical protein